MSIPNAPVNVGDVLAGKYRAERLLGMGAMGVVVEATHVYLGQRVALKFLLAQGASHQEAHQRFLREARAASSLKSEHVARVSDFGTLESGAPYLVMELLDGRDLAAVLEERGSLPIPEAVEYVLQVCEAVAEAHRNGIVHRDLKPANLFLTTDAGGVPCMKVLDFGVSKLAGENLKLTREGAVVGSPLYMSPEQFLGKLDLDERSDVWALAVNLYELVAGITPFHSETIVALHTAVQIKPPKPLTEYVAGAPPAFEAVLLQALDKDKSRRFPNVAAFAAALAPFAPPRAAPYVERVAAARGVTVEASRPTDVLSLQTAVLRASEPAPDVPSRTVVATTSGATSQPVSVAAKPASGARAAWVGVGLLAVVLGGAGVVRWRTTSPGPTPADAAPGPSSASPSVTTSTAATAASADAPRPAPAEIVTVTPEPGPTASVTASARVGAAATPPPPRGPTRTPPARAPTPPARPASPMGDLYDRGDKK